MGTPPKKVEKETTQTVKKVREKPVPPKRLNCFVAPDKPLKQGLMLVSTDHVDAGCYVLAWQEPKAVLLVSEGPAFYELSGKLLKADITFAVIYGFLLLVVLVLNRVWR